jgi:hypothetical protein
MCASLQPILIIATHRLLPLLLLPLLLLLHDPVGA